MPVAEHTATTSDTTRHVAARSCVFGPVTIAFDERVLTPRPWTLEQSRWAADLAARSGPGRLLELCAGAGHIGLVAAMLADRDLVQVEADPVAAAYAAANAERAGWADRVTVRTSRMESALAASETFPVIIADPPYLRTGDVARWPDDPVTAVDGGTDGLAVIRSCLVVAAGHLEPGGWLVLQTAGPAQARRVAALASTVGGRLRPAGVRVIDRERAVLTFRRGHVALAGCEDTPR